MSEQIAVGTEQLIDLNTGALAPVRDEVTIADLPFQGQIPQGLHGMLVRNGPNPYSGKFSAHGMLNWWPEAAMVHDFAITERFSVLLDLSVVYDLGLFERGLRIPIRWDGERSARLGVLPRLGGEVRWFEIDPCFIQHVANAYESEPDSIVLDAVRYPNFQVLNDDLSGFLPNPLGELWRYELDLETGAVTERPILERFVEMPRINEALTGPPGDQNSEPVFVADPDRPGLEEGAWLPA